MMACVCWCMRVYACECVCMHAMTSIFHQQQVSLMLNTNPIYYKCKHQTAIFISRITANISFMLLVPDMSLPDAYTE